MKLYLVAIFLILTLPGFAQYSNLSGSIKSTDSTLLPGVSILLKGTTYGTLSNNQGEFRLGQIKPGTYTILVSQTGYETQQKEIEIIEGNNFINLELKETNIDLNEVVVTGTKTEKSLKEVPVITQVIIAEKMLDLGVTNLLEALPRFVPGLDMSQLGTKSSVTMQGLSANYVLFLIDGERIAGEMNGDIDYSMLNLDNIERVEIIKGASSSLYGSNAIGGVINIITKKISEPFHVRVYSKYSKYNELFCGAGINVKKGILGSSTTFNYSCSDGYDLTRETSHDWTQNPFNSINFSQKFEITPNSKLSIVPYLSYYQFERGNVSARPAHDLYRDFKTGIKGQYFLGNHSVIFSYYRDKYNTFDVLEQLNNKLDTISYDIIQTARIQGNFKLSNNNIITTGIELNFENLFSERIEGFFKKANEEVLFVQEDIGFGKKWNLIFGIRASNQSSYGLHAAPKISLMYRMKDFNLRTSAGMGFRSPTLKELYMDFDHFGQWRLLGNPDLKPESSKYISASAELLKPWNNSSVTVYRNELSNMINGDYWLPDTSSELARQYQNIASAYVYGADLILKQKIFKGLLLNSGYSYVYSEDKQTHLQLYGSTKHSGHIALDYNYNTKNYSFSAQVYCKISGEKFYDTATVSDKPYTNWRITLSQEYKWFRFTAGVDNIFNLILPYNYNFISPGRRYFIGLSLDLGKLND